MTHPISALCWHFGAPPPDGWEQRYGDKRMKPIRIAYELSMPGRNSWNGKWSGDGKPYVLVETYKSKHEIEKAKGILAKQSYTYSFGDGWCACVSVREVSAREAVQFKRKSAGFCGYEWMVDSIEDYGAIYASHQRPATVQEG